MPIIQAPQLEENQEKEESKVNKVNKAPDKTSINEIDLLTRKKKHIGKKGLKISRFFTKKDKGPYDGIKFVKRTSKITNPDGSVIFEMNDVEVPESWSQVATDILAQKYLRKKGVPQYNEDGTPKLDENGKHIKGAETSIKQAAERLAGTWRYWGEKTDYFDTEEDAKAFEEEVIYTLVNQIAVPNSPQWFNTGLNWAYDITGAPQGHYYVDEKTGEVKKSEDAYTRPQPHACFIQSVKDDLVNPGGIFDLVTREARLFKYGSGTGTNFSNIRGKSEPLSGGGESSGLMSFLKVFDAGAGAIRSGGTTRRAAKMVILDIDHPEIEDFIEWKLKEEEKVADLIAGSHINYKYLKEIMQLAESKGIDAEKNIELKTKIMQAKESFIPLNYIKRVLMMVENGVSSEEFSFEKFESDFRSEAYTTVSGQNANNSVRVTNKFLNAIGADENWDLIRRVDGEVFKTMKAKYLWDKIALAAWGSADPGLQFHDTINEWNTCINDGEIIGSNPCSEYMFLDETACNLYQLNLVSFYNAETGKFDVEAFKHVCRLATIILDISILMSQLPSKSMAIGTFKYRTLGLGYANLGTLLMQMGLPYDSEEGFAVTSAVTAMMTGEAYATSAEMSSLLGTFPRYDHNKKSMLKVIRNHKRAAYSVSNEEYEGLTIKPMKFQHEKIDDYLVETAKESWDYAYELGKEFGYRNAHVSCLAPTGTSGLVMDCDTTGIEPDFALVKFKKLVGGGYFKIVNQSIRPALKKLGYPEDQISSIINYAVGTHAFDEAPFINTKSLKEKGFTDEKIKSIESILPTVFELKYAFNKWTLGEEFLEDELGIEKEVYEDEDFDLLQYIGFSDEEIEKADEFICGTMTVEDAPFLKKEHYPVFDCANKCGEKGTRYISYEGHIKQMAAAQPFLSGAISKTINMPEEATFDNIKDAYMDSWKLMIKATALYRDGSKLSQPLSTSSNDDKYSKLFTFDDQADQPEEPDLKEQGVQGRDLQEQKKQEETNTINPQVHRRRLPDERKSITHKFRVAEHEGFITVGLFEDGTPGEIFITISKDGSTLSGIMNALALSISLNLQYGVPLEAIVRKFTHVRFEPSGMTSNPEIPIVKSIIDYIARWMSLKFLDKDKAKMYHTAELVDKAYSDTGSNGKLKIVSQVRTTEKETVEAEKLSKATKVQSFSNMEGFSKIQQQLAAKENNEDAPLCSNCGSITIRNGSCYKCPDCGTTTGCS